MFLSIHFCVCRKASVESEAFDGLLHAEDIVEKPKNSRGFSTVFSFAENVFCMQKTVESFAFDNFCNQRITKEIQEDFRHSLMSSACRKSMIFDKLKTFSAKLKTVENLWFSTDKACECMHWTYGRHMLICASFGLHWNPTGSIVNLCYSLLIFVNLC